MTEARYFSLKTTFALALMISGALVLQNCGPGFEPRSAEPSSMCDPGDPFCPGACDDDPACEFQPIDTPFCSAAPSELYICSENSEGCKELQIHFCSGGQICIDGHCQVPSTTTTSTTTTSTSSPTTTTTIPVTTTTTFTTTTTTIPVTTTTTTTSTTTTTTIPACGTPDFTLGDLTYRPGDDYIRFEFSNIGGRLCPAGQSMVNAALYRPVGASKWIVSFTRESPIGPLEEPGGSIPSAIINAADQLGLPKGVELELQFHVDYESGNPNGKIMELDESNNTLLIPDYCCDCK